MAEVRGNLVLHVNNANGVGTRILLIWIPTLIFWRYFRSRVDSYLLTLELSAEQFLRHLNKLHRS